MKRLIVHGVYDSVTLETLLGKGVERFGFDLRARSSNLIPFSSLQFILPKISGSVITLVFQDDKLATVKSFLDLLKNSPVEYVLEFRDQLDPNFYHSVNHKFLWMFHPKADWKNILLLPHLVGLLLPIEWRNDYQELDELWRIVESRRLEIFLHSADMKEASELAQDKDLNLSTDLTKDFETGFRLVDQDKLKNWELWRHLK